MEQVRELMQGMGPKPQIWLSRRWHGMKTKPVNTTPAAWREAFKAELDLTENDCDRRNFERMLQVIGIAEECGAVELIFRMHMESSRDAHGYEKSLTLEEIWFPKKSCIHMMDNFRHRLREVE